MSKQYNQIKATLAVTKASSEKEKNRKLINFFPQKCAKFEFRCQLNNGCKKARIKRRKTQNQKLERFMNKDEKTNPAGAQPYQRS